MPRVFIVKKARKSKKVRKCKVCGHEIGSGESYRYADPLSNYPYKHSVRRYWCSEHGPAKHEFERNPDKIALLEAEDALTEALAGDFDMADAESAFEEFASAVEELASSMEEKKENIEEGFGHPTVVSEEFEEKAENLRQLASDLQNPDIPDEPDIEEPEGDPEEPIEPDYPGDASEFEDEEEYEEAAGDYEEAMQAYEDEVAEYDAAIDAKEAWSSWREEVRDLATEKSSEVEI